MEITEVRVKLLSGRSDRLRAFCSMTIDDEFVIHDLRVIDGRKGMFVAMPSRKLSDNCPECGGKNHLRAEYCNDCGTKLDGSRADDRDKYHVDVAHPIVTSCREKVQSTVLEAYREEASGSDEVEEDVQEAEKTSDVEGEMEDKEKETAEGVEASDTAEEQEEDQGVQEQVEVAEETKEEDEPVEFGLESEEKEEPEVESVPVVETPESAETEEDSPAESSEEEEKDAATEEQEDSEKTEEEKTPEPSKPQEEEEGGFGAGIF